MSASNLITTKNIKLKLDIPICTLGPQKTDSHYLATKLSKKVFLFDSFLEAMEFGYAQDFYVLVACGFQKIEKGRLIDSWVNLNFKNFDKMNIVDIVLADTKAMCLAKNIDANKIKKCVLHSSTTAFADKYCSKIEKIYVDSKPLAVELCSQGKYSHCIGSEDVVKAHQNLKIIKSFTPQMVWAIHKRKEKI